MASGAHHSIKSLESRANVNLSSAPTLAKDAKPSESTDSGDWQSSSSWGWFCPAIPVPLSYEGQEGMLQLLLGCGDVISHYRWGTYPGFSGHDRFIVTQQNLSLVQIYSGTSPRDRGVIAHSIFAGSLPQPILASSPHSRATPRRVGGHRHSHHSLGFLNLDENHTTR